jgi:hypothetical protein
MARRFVNGSGVIPRFIAIEPDPNQDVGVGGTSSLYLAMTSPLPLM